MSAACILNQRNFCEEVGRAFMETLAALNDRDVGNSCVVGMRLLADMKARGLVVSALPRSFRAEQRLVQVSP